MLSAQVWLNEYGSRKVQRYDDLRAYGHYYWTSSRKAMRAPNFLLSWRIFGEITVKKEEGKPSESSSVFSVFRPSLCNSGSKQVSGHLLQEVVCNHRQIRMLLTVVVKIPRRNIQ